MFGDPTLRTESVPNKGKGEDLVLFALGDGIKTTFPLPKDGALTLGRTGPCDVVIEDPSVSRQHAKLHIAPSLKVEDLGSSNGTKVRGEDLKEGKAVPLDVGETFELGSVMVVIRRRMSDAARARRLATHSYFESRLEEECGRAERTHAPLAVLRIDVDGSTTNPDLQSAVWSALRPGDLLAAYGPKSLEVILPDTSAGDAASIVETIDVKLSELRINAAMGSSHYPQDGRSAEALIARAGENLMGGTPSGRAVIVEDEAMRRVYALAGRVAAGDISVLILGETGAGKEVLAETIHRQSPRKDKPFVRLNCAALSETLLESELFGHVKGAFTGAAGAKKGLLESAEGGTVFLDEIGELPLSIQVKLLRVLEERKVLPVGSVEPISIDVRFLAATNVQLEQAVLDNTFRRDLYYRLNGISIVIPPLRERPNEVQALARQFVAEAAERMQLSHAPDLTEGALAQLKVYSWPGNIRELRNVMERAVLLCDGAPITLEHLPVDKMQSTLLIPKDAAPAPSSVRTNPAPVSREATSPALKGAVEMIEREKILQALEDCAGNQTRTAKMLGISRTTLLARLDAYGIPRPRKKN